MNDRIQALMKQSMVEYQFNLRFSPEKFSELIQQDVLQHLTNTGQDHAREILERYFAGQ